MVMAQTTAPPEISSLSRPKADAAAPLLSYWSDRVGLNAVWKANNVYVAGDKRQDLIKNIF